MTVSTRDKISIPNCIWHLFQEHMGDYFCGIVFLIQVLVPKCFVSCQTGKYIVLRLSFNVRNSITHVHTRTYTCYYNEKLIYITKYHLCFCAGGILPSSSRKVLKYKYIFINVRLTSCALWWDCSQSDYPRAVTFAV